MKISIKTTLLSVFITIVMIVSFSLIISHFYQSEKIALESTSKNFKYLSQEISYYLTNQNKHIDSILSLLISNDDISKPITLSPYQAIFTDLINTIKLKNDIHSIYYTDNNSSFYEVIHIENNEHYFKKYNIKEGTVWVVINIVGEIQQFTYLNKKLKIIGKYQDKNDYNWIQKKWYQEALKKEQMIITMPYHFSHLNKRGITYAKKIINHSVIAIDYTLRRLKTMLRSQQFSNTIHEIFILDKNTNILASTLEKKINQKKISYSINHLNQITHIKIDGKNMYEILLRLSNSQNYIGIRVNADKLLEPYIQNFKYSLVIALLLIMLSIPIIIISINLIVRPIEKLIVENDKIKNRDFDMVEPIDSQIIEFDELSKSFVDMSISIKEYQASQTQLLDSIIKLIAEAIDAKSPYTAGHCKRVPEIALLLLKEANNSQNFYFKEFKLQSDDEMKEFEIGAWLHDCGKVTTPEFVVDKATKLETIYNRINEIRMRFEVLLRDSMIDELQGNISQDELKEISSQLQDEFQFIAQMNLGNEFMSQEHIQKIITISQRQWMRYFDDRLGLSEIELKRFVTQKEPLPSLENLLSDKKHHIIIRENFDFESYKKDGFKESVPKYLYNQGELYNLCITKGTLTPEERYKINEHAIMSIKMLEKIPFPKEFAKIPEYAGTHHETLIGTGYPRKLTKEELSIPARIMAIADIFEALSAADRPYKKAKTLSESLKIMAFMAKEQHIDKELFTLFLQSGVYNVYAKKHLKPQQFDEVDIENILKIIK